MIKHESTETTVINFKKLEERLLTINNTTSITCWNFYINFFKKIIEEKDKTPTLIMATGGMKASAYYLQMFLENYGILTSVIEPRDYFYKNTNAYKRLIALSNSGKTNGIKEALNSFNGEKYLFTGTYNEEKNFKSIYWNNGSYTDIEKSFISIIPTLAPIVMLIDILEGAYNDNQKLIEINNKIKILIEKSRERINNINFNFENTNLIEVISGLDTKVSSTIFESNLIESGTSSVVIHDKGSYCHGRSNLLFQNPANPLIYLMHTKKELDSTLIEVLTKEYPNIFMLHTLDLKESLFIKELYLSLQMYYLSKKIAEDKKIDLTMPEYNPNVIKKLYKFKGEM